MILRCIVAVLLLTGIVPLRGMVAAAGIGRGSGEGTGSSAGRLTGGSYTSAQTGIGVAYWDVDRLYDTVPSLFYRDDDFTPEGRRRWTAERYERKIRRTAAVLDSMSLPIVALCGAENESVVRDLAAACRGDYTYLHRTLNSLDGLDFALLYYGDLFFPTYDEPGRNYLYVEGVLRRSVPDTRGGRKATFRCDTLGLLLVREPRMAAWVARDLREERPHAKLLVMGQTGGGRLERGRGEGPGYGLRDTHARAERAGRGNVRSRNVWRMRDRVLADTALRTSEGEVYARRFLFDASSGTPLATFAGQRYEGGYSRSLPVFVYLK